MRRRGRFVLLNQSCPLTPSSSADSARSPLSLNPSACPQLHIRTQLPWNRILFPSWSRLVPLHHPIMPPHQTPRKRALPATPAADTSQEEEDGGSGKNKSVDAATASNFRGRPAVAPLSPTDTIGIARAIFRHSKPELLTAQKNIVYALEATMSELLDTKLAALIKKGGPLIELTRGIIKEEVDAYGERQPNAAKVADAISRKECTVVVKCVKRTPQIRSAHQMGREDLDTTVSKTMGGFKTLRKLSLVC